MLQKHKRYLQIALNSTLDEAYQIINLLPANDRIILEAGTPLIKRHGINAIAQLKNWWNFKTSGHFTPYIIADLKTIDRGATEVQLATEGEADGVIAMGSAPRETLVNFIAACDELGLDSMLDMMNVEHPWKILRKLPKLPKVVVLHRGVDEEAENKPLPINQINKIKGSVNTMVAVAGGDTPREIQSAAFNGADIIILWKHFYEASTETKLIAENFLREIK